jgi:hypothetical protein
MRSAQHGERWVEVHQVIEAIDHCAHLGLAANALEWRTLRG